MQTIWKGTLARGGRTAEEFDAEVVAGEGRYFIVEVRGPVDRREVSAAEVRGDYWLRALVEAATMKGAEVTP